MVVMTTEASLW